MSLLLGDDPIAVVGVVNARPAGVRAARQRANCGRPPRPGARTEYDFTDVGY
jgi:hypothetical protein